MTSTWCLRWQWVSPRQRRRPTTSNGMSAAIRQAPPPPSGSWQGSSTVTRPRSYRSVLPAATRGGPIDVIDALNDMYFDLGADGEQRDRVRRGAHDRAAATVLDHGP